MLAVVRGHISYCVTSIPAKFTYLVYESHPSATYIPANVVYVYL